MIRINSGHHPLRHLRVILCYKNFQAHQGCSHIGLGVSAINNAKVLRRVGIQAEVLPMREESDLRKFLNLAKSTGEKPITHVIVSAPWITLAMWSHLCSRFPEIEFAMNCHSNVGFLSADRNGIHSIRECLDLEMGLHNFRVAGNSLNFCRFIQDSYGNPCLHLPNLYYLDGHVHPHRPGWPSTGGVLRIGAFGATRIQKNFHSAIGASIEISRRLKAQTEIWISTEREDSFEARRIVASGEEQVRGLPNITLKRAGWLAWPQFRKLVGSMHLLLQPSYTESFNMVTADGVAEGVPSVVSSSITWAPREWQADVDNVFSIARAGIHLVHDNSAAADGLRALKEHNKHGVNFWLRFFLRQDRGSEEFDSYELND